MHDFPARRLLDVTLDRFPHLETLEVIGETTREFILASLARRSENNDGAPALLPALRFLSIELYSFKGIGDCTVDDLKDCLVARESAGCSTREADTYSLPQTPCSRCGKFTTSCRSSLGRDTLVGGREG